MENSYSKIKCHRYLHTFRLWFSFYVVILMPGLYLIQNKLPLAVSELCLNQSPLLCVDSFLRLDDKIFVSILNNTFMCMLFTYSFYCNHYDDVIMTMLASQITSLTVVYSIVYSGVHQRKHQSSASLAFVREIHRGPVNFPHKWPVTRKMFPFDDVIMIIKKTCIIRWIICSIWELIHTVSITCTSVQPENGKTLQVSLYYL